MLDDPLDVRRCFIRLQKEMADLRHRISISMAEKEGILKDTLALRMRVDNHKKNTSPSKYKNDDSDDTVDEDSENDFDDSDNFDDSDDDYSNKDNDHKILSNGDDIPWKISIYPPPGRNLKRLVAWQIERHIQWRDEDFCLSYDCFWGDKKNFCSLFHIRTVKDLKKGKPFAPGNLGLELEHYFHGCPPNMFDGELQDQPWGLPAAALLEAASSHCNNPEDWMLLDEPRKLLIVMEKWYLSIKGPRKYSLTKNAWEWTAIQEAEQEKWSQAFSVCGCGKGKRCRKSRGESERTDSVCM